MSRRGAAWLVSLVCTALGGLLAHALTYRIVGGGHELAGPMHQGHAHHHHGAVDATAAASSHWNACFAICGSLLVLGVLGALADGWRSGRAPRVPIWLFALVPPVGFSLQENLEWLLGGGGVPYAAALGSSLAVGILLQVPFALAAYVAARALLALAGALAERLRAAPRLPFAPAALVAPVPGPLGPPRLALVASGHGQRGPPFRLG
jgi:hypothetical protein